MLLFFGSFLLGRFAVAPETLFRILWDAIRESFCALFGMQPPAAAYTGQERAVVLNIRLPRVALSALVGAGLSVAGTAYQGIFRNPMVSPDILGASASGIDTCLLARNGRAPGALRERARLCVRSFDELDGLLA